MRNRTRLERMGESAEILLYVLGVFISVGAFLALLITASAWVLMSLTMFILGAAMGWTGSVLYLRKLERKAAERGW